MPGLSELLDDAVGSSVPSFGVAEITVRAGRRRTRRRMGAASAVVVGALLVATALVSLGVQTSGSMHVSTEPSTAATTPVAVPLVTAIGDSVMLGARGALEAKIPGIHVDATVSRQFGDSIDIIRRLKNTGQLAPVVVVGLGANGAITDGFMATLQQLLSDRQRVVFVNVKVPRSWEAGDNDTIQRWVPQFGNAVLIDWHREGTAHPEFFYGDNIHVNAAGQTRYAELVASRIPARVEQTTTTASSARDTQGAAVSGYELDLLPPGFAEIRRQDTATPTGGTAHIRWFSTSDLAPTLTTNLTTGTDVGIHALADTRARAADLATQAQRSRASLLAPADVSINGQPGLAYSDPLGWRSLTWAVDRDAVMSVTGLNIDDTELQRIAEGARFANTNQRSSNR